MKKFLIITLVIVMAFSLAACGENGDDGNSNGGSSNTKFSGTYIYTPFTDNYYIEWTSGGGTYFAAGVGDDFCHMPTEEMVTYINCATGEGWSRAADGTEWYQDDYDYSDMDHLSYVGVFSAMEDFFMKYFRAYGKEDSELTDYYVGMEKVAGVNCWVFDTQGLNAIEMKYWIDPSNGCCLKYQTKEDGYTVEITEYNLNYTSWGENMKP